jgi:uncharacterized protein YndB with AHSA1/START domain
MTTTSTTATGQPATTRDFESAMELAASLEAVHAALTNAASVARWWGPTTGSAEEGATLVVSFEGGTHPIVIRVESAEKGRVVWQVKSAPLTPEWAGTTIVFELEPHGEGTTVHFRHDGLTPQLECFDMCHAGWTYYLASLVDYVERGEGQPYTLD